MAKTKPLEKKVAPAKKRDSVDVYRLAAQLVMAKLETWQVLWYSHFAPPQHINPDLTPAPFGKALRDAATNELESRCFKGLTKDEKSQLRAYFLDDFSTEDLFLTRYVGMSQELLNEYRHACLNEK